MIWLLLAHAGAFALWLLFCRWEVAANVRLIAANGSRDTLGLGFHVRRTLFRANVAGLLVGATALVYHSWPPAVGLLVLLTGWFMYYFSPALSKARGLDPYYVSFSLTTAMLDKWLAEIARDRMPNDPAGQVWYAGSRLFDLCLLALTAGVIAEVIGVLVIL